MSAPVSSQIDWRGVAISVSYHRHQWSTFDHIEVNVIGDGIIPVTSMALSAVHWPLEPKRGYLNLGVLPAAIEK